MIKDFCIIFVIIIGIFISHYYIQNDLKNNSNELISKIDILKEQIQTSDENSKNIENTINEIYSMWRRKSDIWSIILEHQEIENIEKSIIGIQSGIEAEEKTDALEKIEETKFMISRIQEKEKLTLKNIF